MYVVQGDSLRKERYNKLCEADRGPRLIVGANWRVDNAKSPAALLKDNNPDDTCIHMYLISCFKWLRCI